jgi:hypothetical protein
MHPYSLLLLFITTFIIFYYFVINVFNIKINQLGHSFRFVIKALVVGYLWYLDPRNIIYTTPTYMITTWWLFDIGLNLIRGQKLWHLGDSIIDSFQRKYPNEFVWFLWKTILFIGLTGAYFFN